MLIDESEQQKNSFLLTKISEDTKGIDRRELAKSSELQSECNSNNPNFLKVYLLNREFYIQNNYSEDATIAFTRDFTIILWTNAAEKLLGYKQDEILGKKIDLLLPSLRLNEIQLLFEKLEDGNVIHGYESLRKHKDGKLIPVGISNTPLFNHKGVLEGVLVKYRDISEKVILEKRLKFTEELWRSAIQSSSFGVWEYHVTRKVFRFHNPWYDSFNLNTGEVDTTFDHWLSLIHEDDIPDLLAEMTKALQGNEFVVEARTLAKSGEYIWVRAKGRVTEWDDEGNPVKVVGTNEDIMERKLMEEQLAQKCLQLEESKKEAELANQAKTKFLSGISHEIRTPMNGIFGILQILKKTRLDQKQTKWVNMIQEAVESQMTIINNMLDISKIEAGKMDLEINLFNLKTLVTEAYEQLRVLCKPKRLEAKLFFDHDIKHMVIGDKLKIMQILLNLLTNAAKFTDHGSISIEAHLIASDDDQQTIEIRIVDTGIGISEQDRNKIFESYYQGDVSIKKKHMGTGLGLSISKQLAHLMNGDIRADSILGVGSTFYFECTLPKYKKSVEQRGGEEQEEQTGSMFLASDISIHQNITRDEIILSIEDNEINQEIIEAVVKSYGFHLLTAYSGEEALMLLKKYQVDIVLMDIQMPGMSGYELTRIMKENDNLKDIPIIAMTAYAMETDLTQCLAYGMNDYIAKPIESNQLIKVISKYID